MENKEMQKNEAEFAGFVDRGTQVVLQDAIRNIVETFAQTDALEDILGYLEEMRESMQNSDERIKELQQKEKQVNDKVGAVETSMRNLLQRIQAMEVQLTQSCELVESFNQNLSRLTGFFEKSGFARMFSKLESAEDEQEI